MKNICMPVFFYFNKILLCILYNLDVSYLNMPLKTSHFLYMALFDDSVFTG